MILQGSKISLRAKKLSDAANNYNWKKDAELAHLDATQPLNISFEDYLYYYKNELTLPFRSHVELAIETPDGKHIGNCSLYNIDERIKEAELGIMIGNRDYWGKGYGSDAVTALLQYAFGDKDMKRVYLKTLAENIRAQRCFSKCGFVPCGFSEKNGYKFMLMDIRQEEWNKVRAKKDSNIINR